MVNCLYKNISQTECEWEGPESNIFAHLVEIHSVVDCSACLHNKIVIELGLDTESSGYRFVLIRFPKGPIAVFEEFFDEVTQLFNFTLRSNELMRYTITMRGSNSRLEYNGIMQPLSDFSNKSSTQCLIIHLNQLKHFSHTRHREIIYKIEVKL